MPVPLETTTRLTSPKPTGIDKLLQDVWDKKRDEQVRTYMTNDTKTAVANFTATLCQTLREYNDNGTMCGVFGSYRLTDDSPKNIKKISDFMSSLVEKEQMATRLDEKNIIVVRRGYRTTGVLMYEDNTIDVVNPVAGVMIDKKIKETFKVNTFYIYLKKLSPEKFAEYKSHLD